MNKLRTALHGGDSRMLMLQTWRGEGRGDDRLGGGRDWP